NLLRQAWEFLMQPRLLVVVVWSGMQHAVWLDEDDTLLFPIDAPQDEVGVEPSLLEESDATAPAQVAQEKHLSPGQGFVHLFGPVLFEIADKLCFARIESGGSHRQLITVRHQQRLVKMPVKIDTRQFRALLFVEGFRIINEFLDSGHQI